MHWNDLRVFLAVARAGRISAAARKLRVEHTTVARRLAALEDALGVQLFYRTAGGYLLTEHGRAVLANAESMERSAVAIDAHVREHAGTLAGRVRVALIPDFASHWLAPNLPAFRALHPAIELQVLVGTRPLDLSRGEADLAVRSPRPHQPGLTAARIAQARTRLYASREWAAGRALRIRDAASARGVPLLVYTAQYQLLQDAAWFQPVLASASVVLSSNSTHALLEAARAGIGVAVLPCFVARGRDDLVAVSQDVAVQDVWLVIHPEFRRDPKIRATADFLKRAATGPLGLE